MYAHYSLGKSFLHKLIPVMEGEGQGSVEIRTGSKGMQYTTNRLYYP